MNILLFIAFGIYWRQEKLVERESYFLIDNFFSHREMVVVMFGNRSFQRSNNY